MNLSFKIRKRFDKEIFLDAKDVHGKKFKGYSDKYGERKRSNKFKNQSSAFSNSTAPVLTGDFRGDVKPHFTKNEGGIRMAAHGSRVNHLAKMDREVTSNKQVFSKGIIKMIMSDVKGQVKKKMPPTKYKKIILGK